MKNIIMAVALSAVAVTAFAAGRMSLNNSGKATASGGQIVECSAGGVTIISDTIPAGLKFAGNMSYSGTIQ